MRGINQGQIDCLRVAATTQNLTTLARGGISSASRGVEEAVSWIATIFFIISSRFAAARCGLSAASRRTKSSGPAERENFTLGDLARHIAATERYVFAECAVGLPSRYKGCGRELADGLDNVIAFMERMHSESMEIFSRMTQADFEKKGISPDGIPITAWKLLRSMLEHEIHHRGQIYVYLGILGVPVPSLYTLNERQLQALSAQNAAQSRSVQ